MVPRAAKNFRRMHIALQGTSKKYFEYDKPFCKYTVFTGDILFRQDT
jgi:hypothetical protein